MTVAEADVAANRITVHSGMDVFQVHGDRTAETTFPFTALVRQDTDIRMRSLGVRRMISALALMQGAG